MKIYLIYQSSKDEFKETIAKISEKIPFSDIIKKGKKEDYDWSFLKDGDYVLIHLGGIERLPDFCREIKEWKAATKKEIIILPISSVETDENKFASNLYTAVEEDKITPEILEESRKFWEEQCGIILKKKIIPLLLGMSLSIDGAEVFRKKNDTGKFESMKKDIAEEIVIIKDLEEQIKKQPVEEWLIFMESIRKIIAAAELYQPLGEKKEFNRIFKEICLDIKGLRVKLQETQK